MEVEAQEAGPSQRALRHELTLEGHTRAVSSIKFSPGDGNRLATASADKTLRIWSSSSGVMQRTLDQHTQGVCDVTWNQDGLGGCSQRLVYAARPLSLPLSQPPTAASAIFSLALTPPPSYPQLTAASASCSAGLHPDCAGGPGIGRPRGSGRHVTQRPADLQLRGHAQI